MPASRIFRFARTSRCAIAGSVTRNACAISVVVSPPTSRSVSATRLSAASAGWQQVKTSARRSSGIAVTSSSSSGMRLEPRERLGLPAEDRVAPDAVDRPVARGRDDPGAGSARQPSRGHRSSAVANASCTASSASSRSPRTRVRIATARPHSSRKTCSTVTRSTIGRISIEPFFAAGMSEARRIASSRSGRSIRKTPPRISFVSAKGPSVTSRSPSRTWTTWAVSPAVQLVPRDVRIRLRELAEQRLPARHLLGAQSAFSSSGRSIHSESSP